jgi:tetratricopeptide (TPR) repeat protein
MKFLILIIFFTLPFQITFSQDTGSEKYFNKGNELLQQARYKDAISEFEKAVTLKPGFADAYSNMATAYYNLGKNAEATKLMQKALQISTNDSTAYNYYENYYYNPDTIEETFDKLREAIKINPRDLIAYYFLGLKYLKGDNRRLGLKFIQKAANLGNLSAINYLKANAPNGKK